MGGLLWFCLKSWGPSVIFCSKYRGLTRQEGKGERTSRLLEQGQNRDGKGLFDND